MSSIADMVEHAIEQGRAEREQNTKLASDSENVDHTDHRGAGTLLKQAAAELRDSTSDLSLGDVAEFLEAIHGK